MPTALPCSPPTGPTVPLDPDPDPDAALVAALRRRDEGAYRTLVRRYTPLMLRLARQVVGPVAAEDVVQDTWLAVLRSIDGFQHRSMFKTWLVRILVNTARTRRAREARVVCVPYPPGDEPACDGTTPASGPEQRVLAGEEWTAVQAALDTLPDRQRTVVVLRDVLDRSSDEVRLLLDLTAGNQRVLLHRGRVRLRELLAHDAGRAVPVGG